MARLVQRRRPEVDQNVQPEVEVDADLPPKQPWGPDRDGRRRLSHERAAETQGKGGVLPCPGSASCWNPMRNGTWPAVRWQ